MGISTALMTIHDDALHEGSAKREIANGLAGLNANAEAIQLDNMTQKYLSIAMALGG